MGSVFSERTNWPLAPNRLHQLAAERRRRGALLDLTASNPTQCGIEYPPGLLAALSDSAGLRYEPASRGLASARAAVAAYYEGRGVSFGADDLLLTASTSEAYAHLFSLLCAAGETVAMPTPSYPLFEMLARLQQVELAAVPMLYDHGWHLDIAAIAAAPAATRALLLVHPNNPAGNYVKPVEWSALQECAAARGWAVVVDEVFWDFPLAPGAQVGLDYAGCPALTFVLNGLSKISALPQMKLGWIAVAGPPELKREALARLELINDLFLAASTPVQLAAGALLEARHAVQRQILARIRCNLDALDRGLGLHSSVARLRAEAGWSALLRLPRIHTDASWAELLVEQAGVLTHPGHFYGLEQDAHLAISLLPQPAAFEAALQGILATVDKEAG